MMHFLTDPFQYQFIQRAALAGVLIAVLCAAWGTFIVLRRMALVGHALSHSALPGLVIAFLLHASLPLGAFIAVAATAMLIGLLAKDDRVHEDTSAGMVPNIMFAAGILLISTTRSYRDLFSMLFGNILGVTEGDLAWIGSLTVLGIAALVLFYKELKLCSFDPDYARAIGIPVDKLRYALLLVLSLTVVVGIQAVGTVLTNALLVIPVASARLLTNRLGVLITLACIFATVAAVSGVYASYYLGLSSGAAIVAACAVIFGISWVFSRLRR